MEVPFELQGVDPETAIVKVDVYEEPFTNTRHVTIDQLNYLLGRTSNSIQTTVVEGTFTPDSLSYEAPAGAQIVGIQLKVGEPLTVEEAEGEEDQATHWSVKSNDTLPDLGLDLETGELSSLLYASDITTVEIAPVFDDSPFAEADTPFTGGTVKYRFIVQQMPENNL